MRFVIAFALFLGTVYCSEEEFFAATAAPTPDLRNEYDRLLIEFVQDKHRQVDGLLMRLTRQYAELEKTKNKDLKAEIINELDVAIAIMKASEPILDREVKRTDLDALERYIFESAQANNALLIKQLTAFEAKVKAIA